MSGSQESFRDYTQQYNVILILLYTSGMKVKYPDISTQALTSLGGRAKPIQAEDAHDWHPRL